MRKRDQGGSQIISSPSVAPSQEKKESIEHAFLFNNSSLFVVTFPSFLRTFFKRKVKIARFCFELKRSNAPNSPDLTEGNTVPRVFFPSLVSHINVPCCYVVIINHCSLLLCMPSYSTFYEAPLYIATSTASCVTLTSSFPFLHTGVDKNPKKKEVR